ncbi:hypothetical protein F2Q70_00018572 [Brassica cretica]|uniref:Uncharacterized protein n=1 Tax=Brassica cretica TaxID=69181 RepID=A0A8S9KS92_BRACR|nr:hypothetical protein F2Q70_00018572 [Brassica cretica]KAF2598280.1 hypothetical protein F2Q68_00012083 [Brassica cretica]
MISPSADSPVADPPESHSNPSQLPPQTAENVTEVVDQESPFVSPISLVTKTVRFQTANPIQTHHIPDDT